MSKVINIIWNTAKEDRFAFHFEFEGKLYEDFRDNIEGMKFALDIKTTAQRCGFYYITNLKQFVTTSSYKGDEALKLVNRFEREGFEVHQMNRETFDEDYLKAA